MKKIAVFGSTGSVGSQALDIARVYSDKIAITCLSAHSDAEKLARQANEFKPQYLALNDINKMDRLKDLLTYNITEIFTGDNAMLNAISKVNCDMAVLAVSGISGLLPFAKCLEKHLAVALANKESIVCGGELIQKLIKQSETVVLPVDSEHSAIFQCLGNSYNTENVENLWITASGGPFLNKTKQEIDNASVEEALAHPNWNMGIKISIDSASLANKGLEIIEAHYLYNIEPEHIKTVIQPKSLIHSMVEFKDATVLAQFAPVDMRLPLQRAILYPEVAELKVNRPLNFWDLGNIEFIKPDFDKFPCLKLAYEAIDKNLTDVFSMANEEAVSLFYKGKISFGQISLIIDSAMHNFKNKTIHSINDIIELNERVKDYIRNNLQGQVYSDFEEE